MDRLASVSMVLAPGLFFISYVWWRTSRTITQHQVLVGVSAGVGSVCLALILAVPSLFMGWGQGPLGAALVGALPGSGINEELAKALICWHLVFRANAFKTPGEILMLCMLIGFGFGLYENIGYLEAAKDEAVVLAFQRGLTATMMHLSLAVLMGAAAIETKRTGDMSAFISTVVLQMVLHASYNFPLLYAGQLEKVGAAVPADLLTVTGVILVTSVVLAMVSINRGDLEREGSRYGDDGKWMVIAGGVVLLAFAAGSAVLLEAAMSSARGQSIGLFESYLALCGPPLVLGIEMLLNIWRKRVRRPANGMRQPASWREMPLHGAVGEQRFGRR
ncbi:MAG: PrsW family intramembrane metalloprotease [Alphaproteobacteria bacterium]|nr:PrsW family intramembrane metalloprotease [Alphaproteobacteria bacterium]